MTTRAPNRVRVRDWEPRFLEALRVHGIVSQAARVAGVPRPTAYKRRNKVSAFAKAWDEAIEDALDALELTVTNASLQGDMQTARWILSRRRPERWGDKLSLEHSGAGGAPVVFTLALGDTEDDEHVTLS